MFPPLHAKLKNVVLWESGTSKIEAWMGGANSYLPYYGPKDAALELAYRYVRRYKPLAFYGKQLNDRIKQKYGNRYEPFIVGLGRYETWGDNNVLPTIPYYPFEGRREVREARLSADKKISRVIAKYEKHGYPAKDLFIAEILLIEAKELINAKTWLYGKKGYSTRDAARLNSSAV